MLGKRTPKIGVHPTLSAQPVTTENVESIYDDNLVWQIGMIDLEGPWGFNQYMSGINVSLRDDMLENLIDQEIPEQVFGELLELVDIKFKSFDDFIMALPPNVEVKWVKEIYKTIARDSFFDLLYPKLKSFEDRTWREILHNARKQNHEVSVEDISKGAQKRLEEIKLSGIATLVSLRFSGKERLWGLRVRNIFKILWYDPDHTVYPSKLKHT